MLSKHEGLRLAERLVEFAYGTGTERTRSRARQTLERLADGKIKLVREYVDIWMNEGEDAFGIGGVIEIDNDGQMYLSNVTFRDDEQEIAVTLAELASNDPPAIVRRCKLCDLPFADPVGKRPRSQCHRTKCQREYERKRKADQRRKT